MKQKLHKHDPDNMKGIRFMVFAMGIALIGGVFVLAYAGFHKIKEGKKAPVTSVSAVTADCQEQTAVTLPADTTIETITHQGVHSILTFTNAAGGHQLITINRCTGDTVQTTTISTQ